MTWYFHFIRLLKKLEKKKNKNKLSVAFLDLNIAFNSANRNVLDLPDNKLKVYSFHKGMKPSVLSDWKTSNLFDARESTSDIGAYMLDCNIVVSEFKLQLYHYVHFRTNTLEKAVSKVSKVGDLCQGWPEGHLFNSYYSEVLLHSLDCSTLPLIYTL